MCLYIIDKQPRIAKRDIMVLKYLYYKDDGQFYTPYELVAVKIGEVLVASPSEPNIIFGGFFDSFGRKIYGLSSGAIHAMLFNGLSYNGNYCAKAIIPKGTKYWVNQFGTEIAAEKMLITKETGNIDTLDDSFARDILAYAPKVNGIRIGDYQMTDDSFVHPKKSITKTKVRGIVCGFYESGKPIICALEMFREVWDNQFDSQIGEYIGYSTVAMRLFDGKDVTRKYIQRNMRQKPRLDAFERCINYRKDKGEEWFFGAFGETVTMLDNAIYLNAAHKITGLGFILGSSYSFWSCSEANADYSWRSRIVLSEDKIICFQGSKNAGHWVVPFYASTK